MDDRFIKEIRIDWSRVDERSYVREIPALRNTEKITLDRNITFFVGENGSGKSTLLEAVAVAYGFNAEGGTKNFNFSTYESHSELYQAILVVKGVHRPRGNYFLRAESFYNVASKAEDYRDQDQETYYRRYGGRSFHNQSHGESFLALVRGFSDRGIYILDEPETALSPQRQLSLLIEINRLAQRGSQFLIVSHSPILLGIPGAKILSLDDGVLHECGYLETESYQVMEMFINNREYLLGRLFSDPDAPEEY